MYIIGDIVVYNGEICKIISDANPKFIYFSFPAKLAMYKENWISIKRKANKSEVHTFKLMESGNHV